MLCQIILLIATKIEVKDEVMKFNAKGNTKILAIWPDKDHCLPKKTTKRVLPQKVMSKISKKLITKAITIKGFSSLKNNFLVLKLSETLFRTTLEKEPATKARGTERISLVRSN